ncbi:GTP-binding protein [Lentibacter algarum]|uniref:CobW family GTP-binding protein n=1 Tax=Lentibacter algarum TaxID=576131 RepID=UPI001C070088|nr:GTP-binding protein [Lentibacter algarum]
MSETLPVTVIGGYLGAGKTTLLNQLLRNADGLKLAVLVNEFGALAIDEDLIEAQSDDLISIAGGCVCCSFGSDLTAALLDMGARNPRPDHVIIEASGVAMPAAIAANVGLQAGFSLAGIVVLADSETIRQQARDDYLGDTVIRQLKEADLVVQTKPSLVSSEEVQTVAAFLETTAPQAAHIVAEQGQIPRDVLLGVESRKVPVSAPHADGDYESIVFTPRQTDAVALAQTLATGGYGLVRAKGFLRDTAGKTQLIQLVGKRAEVTEFAHEMPSELVCIGLKAQLDKAGLEALFK